MWVKKDKQLSFLLPLNNGGVEPFQWNEQRFLSMKNKIPDSVVQVRTPSGRLQSVRLGELEFDSEAITQRR